MTNDKLMINCRSRSFH